MASEAYTQTDRPFRERWRQRRITSRQIALYLAAIVVLVLAEPSWPMFIGGCVFVLVGLAIRAWTFGHLEKNLNLTTTGPYAHSRNPAYLGSLAILVGIALAAGNAQTLVGVALWVAGAIGIGIFLFSYMPRKYDREYSRLQELFPEEERRHATHVPHFWPRLTPWRSGDDRQFSLARLQRNHEPSWALVCAVALAVMWI